MLKSLAGPYAHTGVKFVPTGGVTAGKWQEITRLTKEAIEAAAGC